MSTTVHKHTCHQLGVCQSRTPACSQCTGCVPHGDPDDDLDPDNPDGKTSWDSIAYTTAISMASLLTLAFGGVSAGFIYAKWIA